MNRTASHLIFATIMTVICALLLSARADAANRKGLKAPEITLSDGINGVTAKTRLAAYKGSPVLMVLWLPVCPACRKFMPSVHDLEKKYGPKGLKIVTVCTGKKAFTESYMKSRGWTFGVGFDWTGATKRAHGITSTPGIRLIGADGLLRHFDGTLEAAIQLELPTPKPAPVPKPAPTPAPR